MSAAFGPLLVGLLRDASGNWQISGAFMGLIGLGAMLAGFAAGRDRYVAEAD